MLHIAVCDDGIKDNIISLLKRYGSERSIAGIYPHCLDSGRKLLGKNAVRPRV